MSLFDDTSFEPQSFYVSNKNLKAALIYTEKKMKAVGKWLTFS